MGKAVFGLLFFAYMQEKSAIFRLIFSFVPLRELTFYQKPVIFLIFCQKAPVCLVYVRIFLYLCRLFELNQ